MFERKFVTLGRLLDHWDVIVGQDLAASTTPVKLTYRKKGKTAQLGLVVSADSSQSMRLHYRKDLILAKVNQILGDKTVTDIKFVDQTTDRQARNSQERKPTSLTNQEKDVLSETLDEVEDPDLKEILERFGTSVMIDAKNINDR